MRYSKLNEINGIGKKKAAELLVKFGSIEKISKLKPEELQKIEGIGPVLAKKILEGLL